MINYSDKNIGDQFTAANANEIKDEHNAVAAIADANKKRQQFLTDWEATYSWAGSAASTTSGSATNTVDGGRCLLRTLSTANSTASRTISEQFPIAINSRYNQVNFNNTYAIDVLASNQVPGTLAGNNFWYLYYGNRIGDDLDDPIRKGFGFRYDNRDIKGITHNGTSLDVVDLGVTVGGFFANKLSVISHGDGNVDFYVNNTLEGSSSAGPTGNGDVSESLKTWIKNDGEGTDYIQIVSPIKIFTEQ